MGYDPGVGADLYITNGDFTDWSYYQAGVPSHTLEFTDGYDFRFPDDEAMVQTVFEDSLEFVLSVAESAWHPFYPKSPVDMPAEGIYHTPVTSSYGTNQLIEVVARKYSRPKLYYQINGGRWKKVRLRERLGRFYNDEPGLFYTRYAAEIRGQQAGDTVTYVSICPSWAKAPATRQPEEGAASSSAESMLKMVFIRTASSGAVKQLRAMHIDIVRVRPEPEQPIGKKSL